MPRKIFLKGFVKNESSPEWLDEQLETDADFVPTIKANIDEIKKHSLGWL